MYIILFFPLEMGFNCLMLWLHFTNFRWCFDIQIIIIMVNTAI